MPISPCRTRKQGFRTLGSSDPLINLQDLISDSSGASLRILPVFENTLQILEDFVFLSASIPISDFSKRRPSGVTMNWSFQKSSQLLLVSEAKMVLSTSRKGET